MQGPREGHSNRDSEHDNGERRRREDEDRRRRGRDDERRRDDPERYRDWRERDDSPERHGGRDSLPYGIPRNTQYREGGYGKYGSSSGGGYGSSEWRDGGEYGYGRGGRYDERSVGGYGSSSDNPRREYPGAPQHVKQDARTSEQQRAEEERRAQVARELQQIQERKEEERKKAAARAAKEKEKSDSLPYGILRNTQYREGGYGKYGSSSGGGYGSSEWRDGGEYGYGRGGRYDERSVGGYGSSSDNPRREYPGAPQHVKQDARTSEQQRAEEERRAQVARELQQIQERKEEERKKAAARAAKEKGKHEMKDETREDFPKAREERARLAYWLTEWCGRGDGKPLLPAGMDHEDVLENIHRFYTADEDFSRIGVLHERIQDYMLLGDRLFGQKLSSDAKKIADFLNEKSSGGTRGLEGRDVAVKRLVECAKRKGWLVKLAGLLAKDAEKIELADKAAGESSTFEDVCMAFDKNTEKANGQPLWSLSKKTETNLATFHNIMMPGMKRKFPESRNATRVLEVANKKGWLGQLARYAADKVADDAGDEDDDMPNMSRR